MKNRRRFNRLFSFYYFVREKISESIRLELMVAFGMCLLAATIVSSFYDGYYKEKNVMEEIDYSSGIQSIADASEYMKRKFKDKSLNVTNNQDIDKIMKSAEAINANNDTVKLYITNSDGKILYKSANAKENELNIHEIIERASEYRKNYNNSTVIDTDNGITKKRVVLNKVQEYVEIDGANFSDADTYLIVTGMPLAKTSYVRPSGSPISIIQGLIAFIALFYFLTMKKMRYIEKISDGLMQIAKNNLDYNIEIQGQDELAKLADNINSMAKELKRSIEGERNAEKTKGDLITNVSHDLRTPLTSIKGYLLLVIEGKYKNEKELCEFINIAYNKSEKLEVLINNLFEYTKLNNKGISLNLEQVSLNDLLEQLIEELYVICEENNVVIKKQSWSKKISAKVDGDKIARVFENLLMNAIRYVPKPGEVRVNLWSEEKYIIVSVENRCLNVNDEQLKKIFDRFYRTDESRSEATGGSGLGLAISKSIIELHGGEIWAEVKDENIIFYVKLIISE
ncbi:ATP-binding protein [Clostridium saccharoperbutylacetonicum]|uniref:sensor histidine kinase n=1 Tax=Clostridium saccharoperbutylacetonicum TaxID=36745 RepID=UPI0039EC4B06